MTMEIQGWEMTGVGEPLRRVARPMPVLAPGEVRLKVAGCGVCHTDLGFLHDGVPTRHELPLILGHEVSGLVETAGEGAEDLIGKAVVVPAVIPCGICDLCRSGRGTICAKQVMPGNDRDGGFATHLVVPRTGLCEVPGADADFDAPLGEVEGLTLRQLAVVADAVSTPFQAVVRSGLARGELAVVVGLGGVGGYAAQIARDEGAVVVGLDVDPAKLEAGRRLGLDLVLDSREYDARGLKKAIRSFAKEAGAPATSWKIFECSGTAPGQEIAFGLLVHGATVLVVGFTMAKVQLRLSNLMAFDARALGNWGCDPEHYPEIVKRVLAGRIDVVSTTEVRPLAEIADAFADVHEKRAERRLVLAPDREVGR